MNPVFGVCLVCEQRPRMIDAFLGSCFAFRRRDYFLTAAHVIRDRSPEKLSVLSPRESVYSPVKTISVHPSADLAILKLKSSGREAVEPFAQIDSHGGLGAEYLAFGFPEDSMGPSEGEPTARLFRGYAQRYMMHESTMGFRYLAAELSFPCPGGLSGGPLMKLSAPERPVGLVTESLETGTLLDVQEIVLTKDGNPLQEHTRRVIYYGVGLLLAEFEDWINSTVPRITGV